MTDDLTGPMLDDADDLTAGERDALRRMNPELRRAALEVRWREQDEARALLESRYALGERMLDVEGKPEVYDALGRVQMAAFFGDASRQALLEARRVRRRYDPQRFRRVVEARNPATGFRVTYQHLVELLRVEDEATADDFLNLTLVDSWPVAELRRRISRKLKADRPGPRSASRPRPSQFAGVLENIAAVSREWQRQHVEVWQQGQLLADAFDALPEETITPATLAHLREAGAVVRGTAESAASLAAEVARVLRRAEEVVRRRREGHGPASIGKAEGERDGVQ